MKNNLSITGVIKQGVCAGALLTLLSVPVSVQAAAPAANTSGNFNTYATGLERGYEITGQAKMSRVPGGKTIVNTMAEGLSPNTDYGSHVHNQACSDGNGGGHYQHIVGGDIDNKNEIWPKISTNPQGIGSGHAKTDFIARPEAQSVVIHDVDGARIACADLQ